MAHKHWMTWMSFVCISLALLTKTVADFTTECQRPCDCRWQSGNKAAVCSNSYLKTIPANLSSDIQILDLSNNNLQQLHQEGFKKVGLSNLKKLFLKDCNIEEVHNTAFSTLAIMIELDLSKNKIRSLHPDTFKGTVKLRLINLSYNLIDKLEDGIFRNLKFLQKVEASNNRIHSIGTKAFVNLPQLKILRFNGNNLSHMKLETLVGLKTLSGLDLHNNPWHCDCNLQTFRDWVISHNLYTPPTSCAEPPSVQNTLWNELDSTNFACRPTILEPIPDSTVKSYDENVTLTCKVVGNPPPEVTWRFNGKTIDMKAFGEIRYSAAENTMDLIRWVNLTIIYARYSDRGNYTCAAENSRGRDEKTLSLVLLKFGSMGTIAGMDTFTILVGCLTAMVIIFGAGLVICYFTTQNNEIKRLIKVDARSSNGEVLIADSVASETEKALKIDLNPLTKSLKKYDAPPSFTSEATKLTELNKSLLENESVLASTKDNNRHHAVELPQLSQETLLMNHLTQDHQAYPPDLLSFPVRDEKISPAGGTSQNTESPIKSPEYGVTAKYPGLHKKFQGSNFQGSIPLINSNAYVTLPRRPGPPPDGSLRPQVFSTLNGVIPYNDTLNTKFFSYGGNYYSWNKSEMDLGPVEKMPSYQDNEEPAPSPAPGSPHAVIPKNSLSSPNIHNQLVTLQAMTVIKSEQRPLKVTLAENEGLLKNRDFRTGYSVNVVNGTLGRLRTAPKSPKLKKKSTCDVKEQFLINAPENATQV